MKMPVRAPAVLLSRDSLNALLEQVSYRRTMQVTEIMIFETGLPKESGFYVCPRYHVTLEREFMFFCDRCGQRLDWKNYKRASIVFPRTTK